MNTNVEFFTRHRDRVIGRIKAGTAICAAVTVIVALAVASAHSGRPAQGIGHRADALDAGSIEWHPARSGAVTGYPVVF
jgi:hypothetical protein